MAKTAQTLASEDFSTPSWEEDVFPTDDLEFLDFIGVGNSLNFAFTDFKTRKIFSVRSNGALRRGAFAMWACLRRASDNGIDLYSGNLLRTISFQDVEKIFDGESAIPMIQERRRILREVGRILCERYGGSFRNVFLKGEPRAFGRDGLVTRLVSSFPSFRDESVHHSTGTVLKFQKRAQLMAMMYQGRALISRNMQQLSDFADVGPIADYSVPRALQSWGILEYAPKLAERIAARKLIEKDSVAEQEIRVQTVQAQVMLRTAINALRSSPISFIELDYKLWTMGSETKKPHHLTITNAY